MKESEYQLEEIDVQKYLLVLQRRWMTTVGVLEQLSPSHCCTHSH